MGPTGRRILVVDDHPGATTLLAVILEDEGHTVVQRQTGEGALQAARTEAFDLIVLDLNLPDRDGYDVCSTLIDELEAAPVIVALTGYVDTAVEARALQTGFAAVVSKPSDPMQLLESLEPWLAAPARG